MGKIDSEFQRCVADGKISVFGDGPKLVKKQMAIAMADLSEAEEGLKRDRWKWSTIQAYYSMFHTARALLYAKGFRERHHRCLRVAVSHLYSSEGNAFQRLIDDFQLAKEMRENADYSDDFSENGAKKLAASARKFADIAKTILNRKPEAI